MALSILDSILILLAVSIAVTTFLHRFHLPSILGYLIIGVVVGPYVLNWIPFNANTQELAEFGVVFLLFTVGLEFSLPKLAAMKTTVFGFGGLQVIIAVLVTTGMGVMFGMTMPESIVVGSVVAMSSTAIVLKSLADQGELYEAHGTAAVGLLLFQDLAVIPFLILVPSLVGVNGGALSGELFTAFLKGSAAILFLIALGQWVLRPLFHRVVKTQSMELLTIAILLIVLGAARLTHYLGLSLAMGAFLAGMLLAETEYRNQIQVEIRPFRDVLLGLFFITIGMRLNIPILLAAWPWVLLLLTALICFKVILITLLGFVFMKEKRDAFRTGLVLAHGGEFGFAILSLAMSYALLPQDYGQVVLGALFLSMVMSPVVIRLNGFIASHVFSGHS